MATTAPDRFRLHYRDRLFEVEATPGLVSRTARLPIDGEQVDEQAVELESARLEGGGLRIKVTWSLHGQVASCVAVPEEVPEEAEADEELPFEPPEGSYAAELEAFARRRPWLYAAEDHSRMER